MTIGGGLTGDVQCPDVYINQHVKRLATQAKRAADTTAIPRFNKQSVIDRACALFTGRDVVAHMFKTLGMTNSVTGSNDDALYRDLWALYKEVQTLTWRAKYCASDPLTSRPPAVKCVHDAVAGLDPQKIWTNLPSHRRGLLKLAVSSSSAQPWRPQAQSRTPHQEAKKKNARRATDGQKKGVIGQSFDRVVSASSVHTKVCWKYKVSLILGQGRRIKRAASERASPVEDEQSGETAQLLRGLIEGLDGFVCLSP